MDEEYHWLALALVPGVGARIFHRLLRRFGSPEQVFAAPRKQLEQVAGLKEPTIEAITSFSVGEAAKRELDRLHALDISMIRWGTEEYPRHLMSIPDPPALLYVKGEFSSRDERAVAVVGSRLSSPYGLGVCKRLCTELAWQGWTVVSGMARGIDSAAHLGTLAGNGRTLAVLGSGLDVIYPPENRALYERIAASGVVISEFPLQTPPDPGNFPIRNRLISGLALGVVVVEAAAKSGSLITARMALDQGRLVFAVPGPLYREVAAGPHRLIKEGAKLVENAEDIIEELLPMVSRGLADLPGIREEVEAVSCPELDGQEERVWEVLSIEPLHIDPIARKLGLGVSQTAELLLRLEIKGLVKQLPGTLFVRSTELAGPGAVG